MEPYLERSGRGKANPQSIIEAKLAAKMLASHFQTIKNIKKEKMEMVYDTILTAF